MDGGISQFSLCQSLNGMALGFKGNTKPRFTYIPFDFKLSTRVRNRLLQGKNKGKSCQNSNRFPETTLRMGVYELNKSKNAGKDW